MLGSRDIEQKKWGEFIMAQPILTDQNPTRSPTTKNNKKIRENMKLCKCIELQRKLTGKALAQGVPEGESSEAIQRWSWGNCICNASIPTVM